MKNKNAILIGALALFFLMLKKKSNNQEQEDVDSENVDISVEASETPSGQQVETPSVEKPEKPSVPVQVVDYSSTSNPYLGN